MIADGQRFLENKHTDYKVHFLPFLESIISEKIEKMIEKERKDSN